MTRTRLFTQVPALLCAATVAMATVSGCGGGDSEGRSVGATEQATTAPTGQAGNGGGSTAGSGSGGNANRAVYEARLLTWGRQLARCARSNGLPNFPDPTIVRGPAGARDADFTGIPKGDVEAAYQACADIVRQHPPAPPPTEPPPASTLQHMRQFAACMRERGAGPFPDPRANGTFPILGTQFEGLAPYLGTPISDAITQAMLQCRQFQVEWRMHAS